MIITLNISSQSVKLLTAFTIRNTLKLQYVHCTRLGLTMHACLPHHPCPGGGSIPRPTGPEASPLPLSHGNPPRTIHDLSKINPSPVGTRGLKTRICPPYPQATEMGRFLGITLKRLAPYRCLDGHLKEPYEMSMAWEPDRRSNFYSRPAHLCAVTCITEISLNVT